MKLLFWVNLGVIRVLIWSLCFFSENNCLGFAESLIWETIGRIKCWKHFSQSVRFPNKIIITITYIHPTSKWPPSSYKSWMEVISVRFHASQQSSRVSVFSPSSREVASWTVNRPSCRHCLNVVEWNNVEMIVEMNPGGRSPNRKNHNMDFTFTSGLATEKTAKNLSFFLIL